jgi:3-isopropylmalate/(R)-2-methylmalate dehydratase small subunit
MIIESKYIPLPIKDIDTDMIIPAQYLTSISKEGFGKNLFKRLREQDENFPFNNPNFADAKILVADSNFGCGSSREHAVWAISGWGIQCVIAKSFADIFSGNAAKNNLLIVTLPEDVVDELLSLDGQNKITVDLVNQKVTYLTKESLTKEVSFNYDQFRKYCLIEGKDDLGYLLDKTDEINKYLERNKENRFFSTHK